MKPKEEKSRAQKKEAQAADKAAAGGSATKGKGGRGKKQNNGNTAAGRKVARKTAHSLIERRRRSKMNEEFGVLKDMIPACSGQEMHKLAILQVSLRDPVSMHTTLRVSTELAPMPIQSRARSTAVYQAWMAFG